MRPATIGTIRARRRAGRWGQARRRGLAVLGVALLLGFQGEARAWRAEDPEALVACVDATHRPWASEREGELVGLDVDVLRAVAGHLGTALELVRVPSSALLAPAGELRCPLSAGGLAPEELAGRAASVAYADVDHVLLTRRPVVALDDVAGLRVAVQRGSESEALLAERLGDRAVVVAADAVEEVVALVEDGLAPAALVRRDELAAAGTGAGLHALDVGSGSVAVLGVDPRAGSLRAEVDGALGALRADGTLARLVAAHLGAQRP